MDFRKLHVGTVSYGRDALEDLRQQLMAACARDDTAAAAAAAAEVPARLGSRRDMGVRLLDAMVALAVCHNVRVRSLTRPRTDRMAAHAEPPRPFSATVRPFVAAGHAGDRGWRARRRRHHLPGGEPG